MLRYATFRHVTDAKGFLKIYEFEVYTNYPLLSHPKPYLIDFILGKNTASTRKISRGSIKRNTGYAIIRRVSSSHHSHSHSFTG